MVDTKRSIGIEFEFGWAGTRPGAGTRASANVSGHSGQRGIALLSASVMVLAMAILSLGFLSAVMESNSQVQGHRTVRDLQSSGDSVSNLAAHNLWSGYLAQQGGQAGTLASVRGYFDAIGILNQPAPAVDLLAALNLPQSIVGTDKLAGSTVDSVNVSRFDQQGTIQMVITTTVSSRPGDRQDRTPIVQTFRQAYEIEPGDWQGLDYAMLANNVNCIMCHAEVSTADLFYNQDPSLYNSFSRAKVGTLENLVLRSKAFSSIAGTLYVRGMATNKQGVPIVDWASQTLDAHLFSATGQIVQDPSWGTTTLADLVPAGVNPQPMENLYLDYSSQEAQMVDGYLPTSFPAPFPDDGGIDPVTGAPIAANAGNRIVDYEEFLAIASTAQGDISAGTIHVAGPGQMITSTADLALAQGTGNQGALGSLTSGNVVLTGTAIDPIVIDGDLAIDGDLIIQGYVKGTGSLMVSGNVYIPSDLVYDDGSNGPYRTFGVAADGTQNGLAIATGGNMVIGDLYYQKRGNLVTGDETGSFNFVLSEIALFNRAEWARTQPLLPGMGEDLTNPATWTVPNPKYDATYLPRYYSFYEDSTVPIYNKQNYYDPALGSWVGKEHPGKWEPLVLTYADPTDPSDPVLYGAGGVAKAVVQYLTATDGWITDSMLSTMMSDAVANRTPGEPLMIDALMYSNNSIYGIVSKSGPMQGQMIVNGGIVAADIGLLVPGNAGSVGLNLNFDARTATLLNLKSGDNVTMSRQSSVNSGPQP